jgi:transitional endoplasmic reticulum ATPase
LLLRYYHIEDSSLEDDAASTNAVVAQISTIVAETTGGFVAADINALVDETIKLFDGGDRSAHTDGVDEYAVTMGRWLGCFRLASKKVKPSSLRGVSVDVPTLTYDDIIGCSEAKKSLQRILSVCNPSMTQRLRHFHITANGGALLYGPPG